MIICQADTERERWENIANAVVVQAADDYQKILRRLKRRPKDPALEDQRRMLERFFRSGWFETLCDLDGRALIWKLQMEVGI